MIALLLCAALGADPIALPPPAELPPPPVVSVVAPPSNQAAVVALLREGKVYSGTLISDVGLVLTTAHAFSQTGLSTSAVLLDGRTLDAKVAFVDPARDLALLRLPASTLYPSVPLATALPEVGAGTQVISHPAVVNWTLSNAVLSAAFAPRNGHADPLFFGMRVTNAAVGEGGGVFDDQGRLIGVMASASGTGNEWAVSIDAIRAFVDHLSGINEFTLEVKTEPTGATVAVDGRPEGKIGPGPFVLRNLSTGAHEVRLQLAGVADDVLAVELLQHQTVTLTRHLDVGGQVELASNARAQVWVDGASRGALPQFLTLPSGTHRLDVRASGFMPQTQDIEVIAGTRRALTFTLEAVLAQLSVDSVPAGAVVSVNEVEVGRTPLKVASVPAGAVEIALQYPDKHSYRFKLNLAPKESRDLGTYRLEEPFGWLEGHTLPPGTMIVVDAGERHALQPYERIAPGEHHLEILAPAYYAYSERLSVADAQSTVLDPPLHLYDHLAPRKVAAGIAGGLGTALALVAVGFATDASTTKAAPATAMLSIAGLGAAVYLLVTSGPSDEAGWGEQKTYLPEGHSP